MPPKKERQEVKKKNDFLAYASLKIHSRRRLLA
jgi:hypothetical protein